MNLHPLGAKLLYESGLLFELNRRVLHPFGLALSVVVSEENEAGDVEVALGGVFESSDEEGIIFADDVYREGIERFERFLQERGEKKLRLRFRRLGYVMQGPPDLGAEVLIQKGNEELWKPAETPREALLQQALRSIHAAIMDPELEG